MARSAAAYRSGRSPDWLKMKNANAPAVKREAEEDWARWLVASARSPASRNEQDFPHLVELALPPGGFRSVFLEIDAFHHDRRIPLRRGRSWHEAEQFYIRFCFPDTATADALIDSVASAWPSRAQQDRVVTSPGPSHLALGGPGRL